MPYPSRTLTNGTLVLDLIGENIVGVSDGAPVTTQWQNAVTSDASAIQSGTGPIYRANAYNGHPGVEFTGSVPDILKWPAAAYYDDGLAIIVGVFTDTGNGSWQVALHLDEATPTGGKNLWGFRIGSSLIHGVMINGTVEGADSSSPTYGAFQAFGAEFFNGTTVHHYWNGSAYAGESDTMVNSALGGFDTYFVGGDAVTASQSASVKILAIHVWDSTNIATADVNTLLQAIDDYYAIPGPNQGGGGAGGPIDLSSFDLINGLDVSNFDVISV